MAFVMSRETLLMIYPESYINAIKKNKELESKLESSTYEEIEEIMGNDNDMDLLMQCLVANFILLLLFIFGNEFFSLMSIIVIFIHVIRDRTLEKAKNPKLLIRIYSILSQILSISITGLLIYYI